jgi:tetratricopeptide (TPR) repeat protein
MALICFMRIVMRVFGLFLTASFIAYAATGVGLAQAQATDPTAAAPIPANNTATALPPPPAQALQPVDAATATAAAPIAAVPAQQPALTKEQQTQAAVNAILGDQVRKVAPPATPSALTAGDLLSQGVVVTPRAKEVVIVKRGASASSDRAVFIAADRAFQEGQYSTSVELYDRLLRKTPSNKTALYGKALALHKSGRTDEALAVYERLSLLDPTNVNATANYMSLLRQKDPQRALTRLQNLEQQYPNRPALQGQIGLIYADMNNTPDAVRAFSRAAALDPHSPVYPFNLGVLYDRLGNDQKAAQHYNTALRNAGGKSSSGIPLDSIRDRLKTLDY